MLRRLYALLLITAAWSVPGLLAASINAALFPAIIRREGLLLYYIVQLLPWWCWAVVTPAIVWTVRRHPVERGSIARSLPAHAFLLSTSLFLYVCASAFAGSLTRLPGEPTESLVRLLRGYLGSRIPLGLLLYAAVAAATTAVDERSERRRRELHTAHLEADLARANLQALQMQLQPHFLFNTLHAISMLAQENAPAASRMITQLGDLLRQTLSLADVPTVTLREELELLRRYLDIEQARFGDRLTVTEHVPQELLALSVPSFILQPIVENAIRHGVAPPVEGGRVTLGATRANGALRLEVADDGPGFGGKPQRDTALGLAATRERLRVLYGDRARLSCENVDDGGARVTIVFPAADD